MKVKLIRDKFIDGRNGATVRYCTSRAEYHMALQAKLHEEASEIADNPTDVVEYADLLEVLLTLATVNGISLRQIVVARKEKLERAGGFKSGLLMVRDTAGDGRSAAP